MPATCPGCNLLLTDENSPRCMRCGRSLAKSAPNPYQQAAADAGIRPIPPTGGWITDYFIHIVIAAVYGIGGFLLLMGLCRRIVFRTGAHPAIWLILFLVGFCLPACVGFHRSYKQDQIAKRRKAQGIQSMR